MGDGGLNLDIVLVFAGGFLRPLNVDDVHPGYVSGLNDPEVNRYMEVRYTLQNIHTVTEFVQYNLNRENSVLFGVWHDRSVRHCGTVRLHEIDRARGVAHVGVCLFDKSSWGKKLGLEAVRKVTQWGFDTFNLKQIEAGAYEQNIASQKTFVAAGYKWMNDVSGKFVLDGKPTVVKIYAALRSAN